MKKTIVLIILCFGVSALASKKNAKSAKLSVPPKVLPVLKKIHKQRAEDELAFLNNQSVEVINKEKTKDLSPEEVLEAFNEIEADAQTTRKIK